jgi:hypothetical protein
VLFFQCFVAISKLPSKKGPGRKELLASIQEIMEQLVDWYNEFNAPNPNCMVSLLEAELMMAKNVGKREFPSIKIQLAFEEAIAAARQDEMMHLEAFSCERAALHFEAAKLDGYVGEYMRRAHSLYDQWNAVAKMIEIEEKYAKLLKISKPRARPIPDRDNELLIGGGHGPVRQVTSAKNTRRDIKSLFGIRGPKKDSVDTAREGSSSPYSKNSPRSPTRRLPPPKSSPFGRKQRAAKPRKMDMDYVKDDSSVPESEASLSPVKKSATLKSPRLIKPKIKLPFGSNKKKKKGVRGDIDANEED